MRLLEMVTTHKPRKPRLLFVVESGTDVRLVEGLSRDFEVSVLARRIDSQREITYPPECSIEMQIGSGSRIGFALLAARTTARTSSYDVLMVQGYGLAALACNVAARIARKKSIWMLVCSPIEAYYRCRLSAGSPSQYKASEMLALQVVARFNALLARYYIVLSEYLETIVHAHGARCEIFRIPVYGVDTAVFCPVTSTRKREIRVQLGLATSAKIIFFSSRVAPEKDVETLLDAFRSLLEEEHDLWILHRSGGFRAFVAAAEARGVSERVIATDAVYPGPLLAADYQACDLCVQASREEGLGFSVLEALACETPVVAANVGGLKETVLAGETGWSYSVGSVSELKERIKEVFSDAQEAVKRAHAGRSLVLQHYDSVSVFARLAAIIAARTVPDRPHSF